MTEKTEKTDKTQKAQKTQKTRDNEYWKDLGDLYRDPRLEDRADEFPPGLVDASHRAGRSESSQSSESSESEVRRRDFLRLSGFSLGAAVLAGCTRGKEEKIIPFLVKPEEVTPGRAVWYASSCGGCPAGCGILAKNRDGRPIKLEGNPEHPASRGGLCAIGQARLLGLYDSQRLKKPQIGGAESNWAEVDRQIRERLGSIRSGGGRVRILAQTINSPTARASLDAFLGTFQDARLVQYDPLSVSALLDAHGEAYGVRVLPRFHFARAETIVSFDADFLGTWISPVEFTRGYQDGRQLDGENSKFSYHAQVESRLSLTGSNADHRIAIRPGDQTLVMGHLAKRLAKKAGAEYPGDLAAAPVADAELDALADRLWETPRGRSLIICGSNDIEAQRIAVFLNHLLGNDSPGGEGTVDLARPSYQCQGNDRDLRALVEEMAAGQVAALFVYGVNPVYDLPDGPAFAAALAKIPLVVSFSERIDETAESAHFVCPDHDVLESWSDAEAVAGVVTVGQPTIAPLGDTRSVVESLAAWQDKPSTHYELQRAVWREKIFPRQKDVASFGAFWNQAVHDGFAVVEPSASGASPYKNPPLVPAAPRPVAEGKLELVLYPKVSMGDGRHAHNPWLQELPDPITKVTWDNYAALAPAAARELGLENGDVVRLGDGDTAVDLPVLLQPGQHAAVVAVALGYGHKATERFAGIGPDWIHKRPTIAAGERVGRNAATLLTLRDGRVIHSGTQVSVSRTGERRPLATTQSHHSLHVPEHLARKNGGARPIVQQTTLGAYRKDPTSGSHHKHELISLWPEDHVYDGHHWAMAIDLSRCTGCSACVLACQAENNVPVVGKDEVLRQREMSWIRIDRYYRGDEDQVKVIHQPMMCQHCDNAPCENVCPVLATVHSAEGLNQQVYNRCVGTRYCANNCPYKVRRFNWFDYPREDRLQNMVLNPDVTVRSRGVMEKCSFCIQRIQDAKAEAKREGREIREGDIRPACQQSCPSQAIVFGDKNDPNSEISKRMRDPRHFRVLEELNVLPSVGYLTSVKNRKEEEGGKHHG